jgi:two-component system sensor histidine kinase KdpD
VADEGPGIPQHAREIAFEKFYRGDSNEIESGRIGIGMGLAIARGIVEAHGGHIWIEDGTSGRGARVVFTVPVGDEEDAQSKSASEARPSGRATSEHHM